MGMDSESNNNNRPNSNNNNNNSKLQTLGSAEAWTTGKRILGYFDKNPKTQIGRFTGSIQEEKRLHRSEA